MRTERRLENLLNVGLPDVHPSAVAALCGTVEQKFLDAEALKLVRRFQHFGLELLIEVRHSGRAAERRLDDLVAHVLRTAMDRRGLGPFGL